MDRYTRVVLSIIATCVALLTIWVFLLTLPYTIFPRLGALRVIVVDGSVDVSGSVEVSGTVGVDDTVEVQVVNDYSTPVPVEIMR